MMRDLPDAAINAAARAIQAICPETGYPSVTEEARAALLAALPHLEAAIRADDEQEVEKYRRVIRDALDGMADQTDTDLGPGGGARAAYAALQHAYYAIPAGIPTPPAAHLEAAIRADEREACAREVEETAYADVDFHTRTVTRVAARLRAGEPTP